MTAHRSPRLALLASCVALLGVAPPLAALIGPVYPPPLGVTATPSNADSSYIGRAGGLTMTYTGMSPGGYGQLYYGPPAGEVKAAYRGDPNDGQFPQYTTLTEVGGVLYGMTHSGGASNVGTIFRINPDGTGYAVLRSFSSSGGDGLNPYGSLTEVGGVLYGMTYSGGASHYGTIFKYDPGGAGYTRLYDFGASPDGRQPLGSLTAVGGVLYGMTLGGGASGAGTIFKLNPDGTGYARLYDFGASPDGRYPYGSLTAVGGVLFGMTREGGASGYGTIFKLNPDGTGYAVLRSFSSSGGDGRNPYGSLTAVGGVLYGMTYSGGASNYGTIFKYDPGGAGYTRLYDFGASPDGRYPYGSLTAVGGVLYGMTRDGGTSNYGTIFRYDETGPVYTVLRSFAGPLSDGRYPYGSLTAVGGVLYGMTYYGGLADVGSLFAVNTDGSGFALRHSFRASYPYQGTEVMSFNPGASNLPGGIAAWAGSTQLGWQNGTSWTVSTVNTRLTMTVTDLSSTPLPLTDAGTLGIGSGAVLAVAGDFKALLLMEAQHPTSGTWTPMVDLFNSLKTGLQGEYARDYTSYQGSFWYDCVLQTFYRDADGDGHGNASVSTVACTAPSGYVADNTDCDDTDTTVYPGAPELCDGKDNSCDGQIDEPAFAGLASAAPLGGSDCGVRLDWAATTACAGAPVYAVYRSTAAPFTPGAGNLKAACVTQPFYIDTDVAAGTTYHYIVRAENPSTGGSGPCVKGGEDTNLITRSATPTGCSTAAGDLLYLTARSGDTTVRLEWVNPGSGYVSTRVCLKTSGYPTGPNDAGATCADLAGSAGAYGTHTFSSLANGTLHYFGGWVWNGSGWSGGRFTTGRPFDTSSWPKWGYSSAATALAPAGIRPNLAAFAVSNDRILHAMSAGSSGGTWPASWVPASMNAPAQARPSLVTFPSITIGGASMVAFTGAQDGRVYAFNGATGALLWASPVLGDAVQAGPSVVSSDFAGSANLVLAATRTPSGDSKVFGLNLADGTIAWTFDNTGGASGIGIISSQVSADPVAGRLWFASRAKLGGSSHTLWCLDYTGSGATLTWSRALGDIDGSPIVRSGRLYAGTNAGAVHAVDPATGADLWTAPYATSDGAVKSFVWVQAAGAYPKLYFATTTQVHGVDDTGAAGVALWTPYATASPSPVVVIGSNLYVGTSASNGQLLRLDTGSGGLLGAVPLGDPAVAKTVGAPSYDTRTNHVVVGTDEGVLYAVGAPF